MQAKIQFNTTVRTLSEEGHTRFQLSKPSKLGCKNPKIVWDHPTKSMGTSSSYWMYCGETLSDLNHKYSETVDGLNGRIINVIDFCKYANCCLEVLKINVFVHPVKLYKVCIWAHEIEKGKLTYTLLLDRTSLHEKSIAKHT